MRIVSLILLLTLANFADAAMVDAPSAPPTVIDEQPPVQKEKIDYLLSEEEPYTPRDTEYSVEIGSMAEQRSLYWLAANVGQHVGRCLLTSSQTCQQYVDGIIGVGGRDAETYGLFLGSLRWQFVNFPRSWSPLIRVFGGSMRAHRSEEEDWRLAYGVGLGVITFLHDKVDLRLEARSGYTERPFSQLMIAIHFKADRLVVYFAEKLEELGIMTFEKVSAPFKSDAPPPLSPEKK